MLQEKRLGYSERNTRLYKLMLFHTRQDNVPKLYSFTATLILIVFSYEAEIF